MVLLAMLTVCSSQAFAAINAARYIVYFDAANKPIAAQYINCQNITRHAGVIDVTNSYRMEMQFGCGKPELDHCEYSNGSTFCSYDPDYSSRITYFRSATGYTESDFCAGRYNTATEFVGLSRCDLSAPEEPDVLDPWVNGWGS